MSSLLSSQFCCRGIPSPFRNANITCKLIEDIFIQKPFKKFSLVFKQGCSQGASVPTAILFTVTLFTVTAVFALLRMPKILTKTCWYIYWLHYYLKACSLLKFYILKNIKAIFLYITAEPFQAKKIPDLQALAALWLWIILVNFLWFDKGKKAPTSSDLRKKFQD